MLRKIYGITDAAILVFLGVAILWFALSPHYGLLMNVKFRGLTATGAVLVLVLGLVALGGPRKRPGPNTLFFGLLLLVAFVGRPYLPDARSMKLLEPPLPAGLWDQIDQARFPRKDLQALCTAEGDSTYGSDASFTTVGVAKRLEVLDTHRSFALMTSVMFCCVADAFAIGLRVPYEDWQTIEDGQWIMVSGQLAREEREISLPNFRFGRAMLSSVHKTYYLQPHTVMSYDRVAQLPLLTDQLSRQTNRFFSQALQASGIWEDLKEEGPFTVFVPVDQAIENLSGVEFDELSPAARRRLVSCHIIRGKLSTRELMDRNELETLAGQTLQVELLNGQLRVNQCRLLLKNIEARNGVIHCIYPAITPDDWEQRP